MTQPVAKGDLLDFFRHFFEHKGVPVADHDIDEMADMVPDGQRCRARASQAGAQAVPQEIKGEATDEVLDV
jgi:hypothetical protein